MGWYGGLLRHSKYERNTRRRREDILYILARLRLLYSYTHLSPEAGLDASLWRGIHDDSLAPLDACFPLPSSPSHSSVDIE
jgi:hypothetical protein